MPQDFYARVRGELADIDSQGLTKPERVIMSRQGPEIRVRTAGGEREVLNFCANNYLGLAGDERVTQAGIAASERWGSGTASVRFICGTLGIHKELERAIADYLGFEDAILFAAAFDANGGVFEPLFGEQDAIVSDSLNHASIIDGVRLCKAKRYRFANSDMDDLEAQLKQARAASSWVSRSAMSELAKRKRLALQSLTPSMMEAWFRLSETMASFSPNRGSNTPPLASKAAANRMASSKPR